MRVITVSNATRSTVVGTRIVVAETSLSRVVGLLGASGVAAGGGLLLNPSSGVHTVGMRFAIDVVGLDAQMRVVRLWPGMVPFRMTSLSLKTRCVLELPAGQIAACQVKLGDQLVMGSSASSALAPSAMPDAAMAEPAQDSADTVIAPSVVPNSVGSASRPARLSHPIATPLQSYEKQSPSHPERSYAKQILALALALRLGVLWFVTARYPHGWLYLKGAELGILGRSLALGHGFQSPFTESAGSVGFTGATGPTAFLAPGYPFVISLVFRVFGSLSHASEVAILLLHIVFSVATVALIMAVARRTVGVRAANLAGAFWAVALPLVWMPEIFWDTCASAMLLTGMLALSLRLARKPTPLLWIAAGLYCGITLLINPSLLLALMAMLGWATMTVKAQAPAKATRLARSGPALALLVMLAVYAPWPIRNARVMHAFIPMRTNLGYELWNGNQPGGDGRFVESLHPMLSNAQFREYAALGELGYMREKSVAAKASIRAHPAEFVRITLWRIPAFWAGLAQGEPVNSMAIVAHALTTTCLGFAGLVLLWRRNRKLAWLFLLPLLVFPLPYYVTHPDFRFRLLLDPLLTVLAGYAVVCGVDYARRLCPTRTPDLPI